MELYRCVRCGGYWTGTSGLRDRFKAITHFCPDCVAYLPRIRRATDWQESA